MQTRLDYVNAMLATIGLARVSSLDSQHPQFDKANVKLLEVSQAVQSKGWWFNTSFTELLPNTAGEVILPEDTLSVIIQPDYNYIVQRGTKLYNQNERTSIIGHSVQVRLVELIDFENLPPTAQEHIGRRAKEEFFTDRGGTEPKLSKYNTEAQLAWVEFRKENLRHTRPNGIPFGWYRHGSMHLSRRDRTT